MNPLNDIYYQKKYVELYLKNGDQIFEFKHQFGTQIFYNLTIKRPITKIGNIDVQAGYYDLETAYGYGGIYSNSEDVEFLQQASDAYIKHCQEQNIIAEFTRFHPFNQTPQTMPDYFNFLSEDRDIVYVDTSLTQTERWAKYSKNTRNILRKCAKNLNFEPCTTLDDFITLYQKTMDKNAADSFYYFDRSYFERLISMPQVELYNVLYEGKVISSTFFLWGDDFGHYHLSANDYEYRAHNANYFILDSLFDVAGQKNIPKVQLGGGRTNQTDDSLLKFKHKFSPLSKSFSIAGKIFNKPIFDNYVDIWQKQSQTDIPFFLKYRLGIE